MPSTSGPGFCLKLHTRIITSGQTDTCTCLIDMAKSRPTSARKPAAPTLLGKWQLHLPVAQRPPEARNHTWLHSHPSAHTVCPTFGTWPLLTTCYYHSDRSHHDLSDSTSLPHAPSATLTLLWLLLHSRHMLASRSLHTLLLQGTHFFSIPSPRSPIPCLLSFNDTSLAKSSLTAVVKTANPSLHAL